MKNKADTSVNNKNINGNNYGHYPKISDIEEVVYPGVPPILRGYLVGDQGKAFNDPSMLVLQIIFT